MLAPITTRMSGARYVDRPELPHGVAQEDKLLRSSGGPKRPSLPCSNAAFPVGPPGRLIGLRLVCSLGFSYWT